MVDVWQGLTHEGMVSQATLDFLVMVLQLKSDGVGV